MNIFIRQSFGGGVPFKTLNFIIISLRFESRFLCILTGISGNNGSA